MNEREKRKANDKTSTSTSKRPRQQRSLERIKKEPLEIRDTDAPKLGKASTSAKRRSPRNGSKRAIKSEQQHQLRDMFDTSDEESPEEDLHDTNYEEKSKTPSPTTRSTRMKAQQTTPPDHIMPPGGSIVTTPSRQTVLDGWLRSPYFSTRNSSSTLSSSMRATAKKDRHSTVPSTSRRPPPSPDLASSHSLIEILDDEDDSMPRGKEMLPSTFPKPPSSSSDDENGSSDEGTPLIQKFDTPASSRFTDPSPNATFPGQDDDTNVTAETLPTLANGTTKHLASEDTLTEERATKVEPLCPSPSAASVSTAQVPIVSPANAPSVPRASPIQYIQQDVRAQLACPICMELCVDTVQFPLPCGHYFCRWCIQHWQVTSEV